MHVGVYGTLSPNDPIVTSFSTEPATKEDLGHIMSPCYAFSCTIAQTSAEWQASSWGRSRVGEKSGAMEGMVW